MEQIESNNSLLVEYCLLTFVILWSGGYATYGLFPNWYYLLFVIAMYIMLKRDMGLERKHLLAISAFAIIAVFHSIVFHGPITSIAEPTLRLLAIAMVAAIVRPNLNHVFISITAFFAGLSLMFWLIDLTPGGHSLLLDIAKDLPQFGAKTLTDSNIDRYGYVKYSLYFYSVSDNITNLADFTLRNSGPFFEPGRFTVPLCISLAMILFTGQYENYKIPFYTILLANLTTLSTTGYLAMITLFVGYFGARSNSSNTKKILLLALTVIGSYYLIGLDFMGEKIASALDNTDIANTRFGAMFYHLTQIQRSPWIGYGVFLGKLFPSLEMSPCGITDMMRIWGIPMFLLCVAMLYQGTRSYLNNNWIYRIVFVFILLYVAFTQTIMNEPLFYLLYFIGSADYLYNDEEEDDDEEDEEELDEEEIHTENAYAAEF